MLHSVVVTKVTSTASALTHAPLSGYEVWGWLSDKLLVPSVVGLVIAIAGLVISRANEKYKAQREHLSATVDTLRSKTDDAVDLLTSYWNTNFDPNVSPVLVAKIEYHLQDISGLIGICLPDLWKGSPSEGQKLFNDFVEAATGAAFNTPTQVRDAGKMFAVGAAAAALLEGISLEMGAYHRRSMVPILNRK